MKHYAGLDVSVKETAICIIDERWLEEGGRCLGPSHRCHHAQNVDRRQRFPLVARRCMSNLLWLVNVQMERLRPFFPKSHGKPCIDDRGVFRDKIFINRNGLRWCDAPRECGLPKTLYNRWKRWGDMGVFARMMEKLASESNEQKTVMIDATYLRARHTPSSLRAKKRGPTTNAGA